MASGSAFSAGDIYMEDLPRANRGATDGCVQPPLGTCTSAAVPQVEGAARGKVYGQRRHNLSEQECAEPAQASLNLCRRWSIHQRC